MAKRQPTGDYKVGYARTSDKTKWKKGQSGNPKGRPKAKTDGTEVLSILSAPVKVQSTKKRGAEKAPYEVYLWRLVGRAITERHVPSMVRFLDLAEKYGLITALPPTSKSQTYYIPQDWHPLEWEAMFALHGPPPWDENGLGLVPEKNVW